jgi:hypothetical protein
MGRDAFEVLPSQNERYLQAHLCIGGDFMSDWNLESARNHFKKVIEEIPKDIRLRRDGPPAIPTTITKELRVE